MNLLDMMGQGEIKKNAPLAERMKPQCLEDFVGQENIIGEKSALRRMITRDRLISMIFYGPSGSGKTSIAKIISNITNSEFIVLNAVTSGIADIKGVIADAKNSLVYAKRTIVFVDEIHRFNKAQQDVLLPYVEDGTIVLIGATTENPYFEVNPALMSRCILYTLNVLSVSDIKEIIVRAVDNKEIGIGDYVSAVDADAIDLIAILSGGDARKALNMLEIVSLTKNPDSFGNVIIDIEDVKETFDKRAVKYDKNADEHYNVISAFIKSIRGGDADAALHYLARMIEGGEDPIFIARRLVISAAEDIGNADPMGIVVATACLDAVKLIGMPEGRIPLAQAATYLARAPKSYDAYIGLERALNDVRTKEFGDVPNHLKDAGYKSAKKLGHGLGYKYPFDYPGNTVEQQYLPDNLVGTKYYDL